VVILPLVLAAAAALPPVIADPRAGGSDWILVRPDDPLPVDGMRGALVALPAPPQAPDQRWLERVVELAARGGAVIAIGAAPPPAALLPYLDGVAIDPAPAAATLATLAAGLAGVPLVVPAADPAAAVELLAAGASAVLLPSPAHGWAAEAVDLLPEPAPAMVAGRPLATALRGGDLATVVGLPAGFAGGDVRLADTWYGGARLITGDAQEAPLRVEPGGARVTVPALPAGGLLVALRPADATRLIDRVEVTGAALPTVAEVLARHQRAAARQERAVTRWRGEQRLAVRVWVGDLGRSFELVLEGPAFFAREVGTDWEVRRAWVDGVAWDPNDLPDLPLLEPERPPVPALALRLDPGWEYRLDGMEERGGARCFVVSFVSRSGAQPERRGRAFVASGTYALVDLEERVDGLTNEVLSSHSLTSYEPREVVKTPLWLPRKVAAEDLVAVFGGTAVVRRELTITGIELDPPGFADARARAWAGPAPMFRDTPAGLVPLASDGRGGRVPGTGRAVRQVFLLGGVVADPGLAYPLPYGGVQLQDFDFRGRGEQLRVFAAGVVNDAAWSARHGRVELSLRGFLQLLPFAQSVWADGVELTGEALEVQRQRLGLAVASAAGPVRLKLDAGVDRWDFGRTDDTAAAFAPPPDTFEGVLALEAATVWRKTTVTAGAEAGRRFTWAEWGYPGGEAPRRSWQRYHLGVARESTPFPLAKLNLEAQVWTGVDLDRFSAPAPGRFGPLRLRGLATSRVTPDGLALVRGTFAVPVGVRFRAEFGADLAWARERRSDYHARPLSGVGLGLSLAGPWRTILQMAVAYPLVTPGPRGATFELFLLRPLHSRARVAEAPRP
jgi:hypothetical protein